MVKDDSIVKLIGHLKSKFGADSFLIQDYWDGDLCATGLSDTEKKRLLYVNTFERQTGYFFLSLEDTSDPIFYKEIAKYENADIGTLEQIFMNCILQCSV